MLVGSINDATNQWKPFDEALTKWAINGFKPNEPNVAKIAEIKTALENASSYLASYQGANLVINKFPDAKNLSSKAASKREWDSVCAKLTFATASPSIIAWVDEIVPSAKPAVKAKAKPKAAGTAKPKATKK